MVGTRNTSRKPVRAVRKHFGRDLPNEAVQDGKHLHCVRIAESPEGQKSFDHCGRFLWRVGTIDMISSVEFHLGKAMPRRKEVKKHFLQVYQ